ncbi:GNAT family N-acetyltransferase [Massilia glaciei]|nr:GNAT family N-acetyltransferase [Massilia glaciei]
MPEAPGLTLRSVQTDDQPFLDALYRSTRDDLLGSHVDPALVATLIAMQQMVHENGQRKAYPQARRELILRDGEALGRIVTDSDPLRGMRVVDIALLPRARGRGHGGAILRRLQREAAALQVPLRLSVAKGNAGARRLYLALGFEVEEAGDAADQMVWRARGRA